jgi:hypothetical protein
MAYQKLCYWVDHENLEKVRKSCKEEGIELKDEARIPCRVLRTSWEVGYLTPPAWYGLCKRRTSWYWESEKAGKVLVVSNTSLDPLDVGNPIVITESSFKPDRLPSPKEITRLIKSETYQQRKPSVWENIEPVEKEFYQTWFERHRANEPFDFDNIFASHSANHSNFIDPKYFVTQNGLISPYSIAGSSYVCSSCLEFFNILGEQWPIKYVVPCIGAVLFAHLPMDQYFEVRDQKGEGVNKNKG